MRPTPALAVIAALSSFVSAAPAPGDGWGEPIAGMKTIDLPLLLDLPGDLVHVRYTPGSLDRSASVQTRFELFTKEFGRSGFQRNVIVIFVLSREDWVAAKLSTPYGIPQALGLDGIAIAGWADEAMVKATRERLGGELPVPQAQAILATPAESASLAVVDILTQLEISRILVERARLTGDRPWIGPVMAHLVARLFWDRFEPGRAPEIAAIVDRLAANDKHPGRRRLADWRPDLAPAERWWYDARFMRGADLMVVAWKPGKLWKLLQKGFSGKEPITEARLLTEFPGLNDWRIANFAP